MNQKRKIEESKELKRPSLNNYLVAAFLDDSIQFADIEKLKVKMREMVLKFGTGDQLIKERSEWRSRGDEAQNTCSVIAEDLFVIPEAYIKALAEYEADKREIESKVAELEAQKDTILLKIQIGSNAVLDKLITQVDNLADLNIMNSQFLLTT